jgi:hypothetical protein
MILGIYICNSEIIEHGLLHYKAMKHFFLLHAKKKNMSKFFMIVYAVILFLFIFFVVSNCSKSLFLSFGIYIFTIDSIYHSLLVTFSNISFFYFSLITAYHFCLSELDCPKYMCDLPKFPKCGWYNCSCEYGEYE